MPYSVSLSNRLKTTDGGSPTDNLYSATLASDNDSASSTTHNQARSGGWRKHGQRKGLEVEEMLVVDVIPDRNDIIFIFDCLVTSLFVETAHRPCMLESSYLYTYYIQHSSECNGLWRCSSRTVVGKKKSKHAPQPINFLLTEPTSKQM